MEKWKTANETVTSPLIPTISGDKWYAHFKGLHAGTIETNLDEQQFSSNENMGRIENDKPYTRKEFDSVINNMKDGKAMGSDSISNEMIKNSPEIILDILYKFVNLCLKKSLVPKSWCLDLLNPIHKEGNTNDHNNYRGICISSALLKIICSLLNKRIQNKLYACFVDFKKAFDSVWHKGLFYKMKNNNLSGKVLDLIKDIYKKTKCAIKVKDSLTEFFDYNKGVRQGCPLSPILFNIYVNDIIKIMNENNRSNIFLNKNDPINALMFADDLILLSGSEEGLQKQMDKLNTYCETWKLNINLKKTKIIILNRGNRLRKSEFKINKVVIENVKRIKYLGFTKTAKNCSFLPTLEDLSIKANRAIYTLNTKIKISRFPTRWH